MNAAFVLPPPPRRRAAASVPTRVGSGPRARCTARCTLVARASAGGEGGGSRTCAARSAVCCCQSEKVSRPQFPLRCRLLLPCPPSRVSPAPLPAPCLALSPCQCPSTTCVYNLRDAPKAPAVRPPPLSCPLVSSPSPNSPHVWLTLALHLAGCAYPEHASR